jgi:NADH-quinone oxidoreductase subunit H
VIVKMLVIGAKITFFIFLMMWVRWTLPRFRYDQLMRLAWQRLIPMTLALLVLAVVLLYLGQHRSIWAIVGNGVILAATLWVASRGAEVTGREVNLPRIQAATANRLGPGVPA